MTPACYGKILQKSWSELVDQSDIVAQTFYSRLFEIDPSTPSLFQDTNMVRQRRVFVNALSTLVEHYSEIDKIKPVLADLGKRHKLYGVRDSHYDSVGVALIWALGQCAGSGFKDDVRRAWITAYAQVSDAMRCGADNNQ